MPVRPAIKGAQSLHKPPSETHHPAGTHRGLRLRIWAWGLGAVVVLFSVACVVHPLLETRAAVLRCKAAVTPLRRQASSSAEKEIIRLGGSGRALQRLRKYVAMPDWVAPNPEVAKIMICRCGQPATNDMLGFLAESPPVREEAALSLAELGAGNASEILAAVAGSSRQDLRLKCIKNLASRGSSAKLIVPQLLRLFPDEDNIGRRVITNALKRILGSDSVMKILVLEGGQYFLGDSKLELDALLALLAQKAAKTRTPDGLSGLVVVINAERSAKYKDVRVIAQKCLECRIHRVAFACTIAPAAKKPMDCTGPGAVNAPNGHD